MSAEGYSDNERGMDMRAQQTAQIEHEQLEHMSHEMQMVKLASFGLVFQLMMGIFYAFVFQYDEKEGDSGVSTYYGMYQDVHVMIFVGFGFLMTFLKKYGYGAVGFNFMLAAYVIQWSLLCNGFFDNLWKNNMEKKIDIQISDLIKADFAAGAVMISFGAVIGRLSPFQLVIMSIFEIIFYNINEHICVYNYLAVDMGGSMYVHVFGAYFGLAVSYAICSKKYQRYAQHPLNIATVDSDMFAMIGTLFLWMFWPSFTAALAEGRAQYRVIVNTVLALASCCTATFNLSLVFRPDNRFCMIDIQNASLAGGVAVGSACDLVIEAYGAVIMGFLAAWISTVGYTRIQPFLERKLALFDTCGVHNLHGMPGVLGALAGAVSAVAATEEAYGKATLEAIYPARADGRTGAQQCGYQLLALTTSISIAIVSGLICGNIVKHPVFYVVKEGEDYDDTPYWTVRGDHEH